MVDLNDIFATSSLIIDNSNNIDFLMVLYPYLLEYIGKYKDEGDYEKLIINIHHLIGSKERSVKNLIKYVIPNIGLCSNVTGENIQEQKSDQIDQFPSIDSQFPFMSLPIEIQVKILDYVENSSKYCAVSKHFKEVYTRSRTTIFMKSDLSDEKLKNIMNMFPNLNTVNFGNNVGPFYVDICNIKKIIINAEEQLMENTCKIQEIFILIKQCNDEEFLFKKIKKNFHILKKLRISILLENKLLWNSFFDSNIIENLSELNISGCCMDYRTLILLFSKCQYIRSLDCSGNRLDNDDVVDSLAKCKPLFLKCLFCFLTDNYLEKLLTGLGTGLISLDISHNPILFFQIPSFMSLRIKELYMKGIFIMSYKMDWIYKNLSECKFIDAQYCPALHDYTYDSGCYKRDMVILTTPKSLINEENFLSKKIFRDIMSNSFCIESKNLLEYFTNILENGEIINKFRDYVMRDYVIFKNVINNQTHQYINFI
jgi:hypothetical protein